MIRKRIMVDMSATIIHHGHIRLLKKASEYGDVVVGLTSDDEITAKKGYQPEIIFEHRKEVLESIQFVSEVVSVPWLIDEKILDKFSIDYLVHGDDNNNLINKSRLKIFPRTQDVSSSDIRESAQRSITQIHNQKLMLTPGPAVVLHENLKYLKPIFGRGDEEYLMMANSVIEWIKNLSGQDEVVMAQGSATFSLELAAHSFVSGKILLISTGYYSDRLEKLLPKDCNVTICKYEDLSAINEKYDWVLCAYTETSIAFKIDLSMVKKKTDEFGAKLYVDATGSIGLEENHYLADVMAFSSCKGLFGLTGGSFVAYKKTLNYKSTDNFYFNLETQINKMTTGPYHAIASLYGVMKNHDQIKQRVINSKNIVLKKWSKLVRKDNQPLLCTYIEGKVVPNDDNIVLYSPRSELNGSVICHFGEMHHDELRIDKRIRVE
tara:strand:+ start:163 stop:1467 length:1305 start_codon:yes stop_codon:yes gene_type:complete